MNEVENVFVRMEAKEMNESKNSETWFRKLSEKLEQHAETFSWLNSYKMTYRDAINGERLEFRDTAEAFRQDLRMPQKAGDKRHHLLGGSFLSYAALGDAPEREEDSDCRCSEDAEEAKQAPTGTKGLSVSFCTNVQSLWCKRPCFRSLLDCLSGQGS
ncbi:hypothetical protein ACJ73_06734 [Blastomyces percursus]|uniref:Uncharacterized protein n=1 Tax=Blastomyces percursus TaxID=1658174 RepID=A0A1J9R2S5_9EURO|nr:hypothetical protein ACJ73_06734 [Blastomyces percursus]